MLQRCCQRAAAAAAATATTTTTLRGLHAIVSAVCRGRVQLQPDDVYKICAVLRDDVLSLRDDAAFCRALATCHRQHIATGAAAALSPFQTTLIDAVLSPAMAAAAAEEAAASSSSSDTTHSVADVPAVVTDTPASSAAAAAEPVLPAETVQERLSAIWDVVSSIRKNKANKKSNSSNASDGSNNNTDNSNNATSEDANDEDEDNDEDDDDDDADDSGLVGAATQLRELDAHMRALEGRLRELSPHETCALVKALASVHYQNYDHTALLSRRGCEVATTTATTTTTTSTQSPLPRAELCKLYFNLHKLHTHDSLAPLVQRLLTCVSAATREEVYVLAQALRSQANTSPAGARLTTAVATRAAALARGAASPSYHRAVLMALSRYMQHAHLAVALLLRDVCRFARTMRVRDVLALLQVCLDLRVAPAATAPPPPQGRTQTQTSNDKSNTTCSSQHAAHKDVYAVLLSRLQVLVPSMHMRHMDTLVEMLSRLPVDSGDVMRAVMRRLENDAGHLGVGAAVHVLRVLSSYPPAKGGVCIVSLAFAIALRAGVTDAALLTDALVSLALLGHYTDDFFAIWHTLQHEKGGVRSFAQLATLLECLPRRALVEDGRARALVVAAVVTLAPALSDEEASRCSVLLQQHLGIDDAAVHERLGRLARRRMLQQQQQQEQQEQHRRRHRRGGGRPQQTQQMQQEQYYYNNNNNGSGGGGGGRGDGGGGASRRPVRRGSSTRYEADVLDGFVL